MAVTDNMTPAEIAGLVRGTAHAHVATCLEAARFFAMAARFLALQTDAALAAVRADLPDVEPGRIQDAFRTAFAEMLDVNGLGSCLRRG